MKKILLLLLLTITAAQLHARPAADLAATVTSLRVQETTQAQVKGLLGMPKSSITNEKETLWLYESGTQRAQIFWDNATSSLMKCVYTSADNRNKTKLDDDKSKWLKIHTPLADIISHMGTPANLVIDNGSARLEYKYNNATLHLYFLKGILLRFQADAV